MAEFSEVMRQWNRMCNIIDKTKYICSDSENGYICPMRNNGLCNKYISEQTDSDWKDGEKIIMSWAAEHPEPVYPTWGEYLHTLHNKPSSRELSQPIPADIAQKLGIELKEG